MKKHSLYWFCRSFTITAFSLLLLCSLFFGLGYCENKMQQALGQASYEPLSKTPDGIYFYRYKIIPTPPSTPE